MQKQRKRKIVTIGCQSCQNHLNGNEIYSGRPAMLNFLQIQNAVIFGNK